jgi:hypothetical protein
VTARPLLCFHRFLDLSQTLKTILIFAQSINAANQAPEASSADDSSLRQAITGQAFAFRELAAATDHFTPYNLVGEGGFFRVYKGKLEKSGQVRTYVRELPRAHTCPSIHACISF